MAKNKYKRSKLMDNQLVRGNVSSHTSNDNVQNGLAEFCASGKRNPLLFPEILEVLFTWLENDPKTLRASREVCQQWNIEACKVLGRFNDPIRLKSHQSFSDFHELVSKPISQPKIIKGIIFRTQCCSNSKKTVGGENLEPSTSATSSWKQSTSEPDPKKSDSNLVPSTWSTPRLWGALKIVGSNITFLDISMVYVYKDQNQAIVPVRMRLSDLRKIIFVLCPNLTHLVLRELQQKFISKQKFVPLTEAEASCCKLKSIILKNEIRNDTYRIQQFQHNSPHRYHSPCPEFYGNLLRNCPALEEIGYYFHLAGSSFSYLTKVIELIQEGRLQNLKSIKRFSYGTAEDIGLGLYTDCASVPDLKAKFTKISFCANLAFIPAQLSNCFSSSYDTVQELNFFGYYYNEDNYLNSVMLFDENNFNMPYMYNLKRLCLRGGIPLEPFLVNAPNLEELTFSFLGTKNKYNQYLQPIKFWNEEWHGLQIQPLCNLTKLDIGHCAFICPHDIKVIAKLCPNVKKIVLPSLRSGCVQTLFEELSSIQELDLVLMDANSCLTNEMLLGDPSKLTPGISALHDLRALRIRVNEITKRKGFVVAAEDECLLTNTFLVALCNEGPKLSILHLEAGNFTDEGWLQLNSENMPCLVSLMVPRIGGPSEPVFHKLRNSFPLCQIDWVNYNPTKEGEEIRVSGVVGKKVQMPS